MSSWNDIIVVRRYALLMFLFTGFFIGLSLTFPIFFSLSLLGIFLLLISRKAVSKEDLRKELKSKGYIKKRKVKKK